MNDICTGISSTIQLFADDCVLYRIINNLDDCTALQHVGTGFLIGVRNED